MAISPINWSNGRESVKNRLPRMEKYSFFTKILRYRYIPTEDKKYAKYISIFNINEMSADKVVKAILNGALIIISKLGCEVISFQSGK
jgi:hypothetical protein